MEEHEIKSMGLKDLAKYMDLQVKLGNEKERTQGEIAKIRGVSVKTLIKQTSMFREKGEQKKSMEAQKSTPNYSDFTEKEIEVLKKFVKERENNIKFFDELQIYRELKKVPVDDTEKVRSAFNMSKKTTERLKKYSQIRRIPLQDLVELFVMNGLEKYDK